MLDFEMATRKMMLGQNVTQKKNHVRDDHSKGITTVTQSAYNSFKMTFLISFKTFIF